jgi:hypothetical protein
MTPAGPRKHLQGTLSNAQREAAREIITVLTSALVPADPILAQQQRLALIGRMLLAYPAGDASEEATMARCTVYLESLDDIPQWAVRRAIRQWDRGEAGKQNYAFMPAPAVLRGLALSHMARPRLLLEKMQQLLEAAPSCEVALREERKPSAASEILQAPV